MAIKVTTWRPDTCGCVIQYEWDDSLSNDLRVHTGKNIEKTCESHKNIIEAKELYIQLTEENQRKNLFLKEVIDTIPTLKETKVKEDGSVEERLKKGVTYEYLFDDKRNLVVDFKGEVVDKNVLKLISSSKFQDKVIVK